MKESSMSKRLASLVANKEKQPHILIGQESMKTDFNSDGEPSCASDCSTPFPETVEGVREESLRQANEEIRRLRRGLTEAEAKSDESLRDTVGRLLRGPEVQPLRCEWDHHLEDEGVYPFGA